MRVLETRDHLDLLQESPNADGMRQRFLEHLDRNLSMVPQIVGEVHAGHPALADLAFDPIAVADGLARCRIPTRCWDRYARRGDVRRCRHGATSLRGPRL